MGKVLQAFSDVDLKSVCTKGQYGVAFHPWAHCHGIGALQPTLEPPYVPNFDMCRLHNRLWEPTSVVGSRGGAMEGQLTPLGATQSSINLPGCLQVPPLPLHTIKGGNGARWRSVPFISKLSNLA